MRLLFPDACAGAAFLPPATGAPAAIRQQLGPVDCERGPVDPGGQGEWRSRPAHGIVTRILKFALDNIYFNSIGSAVSLRARPSDFLWKAHGHASPHRRALAMTPEKEHSC